MDALDGGPWDQLGYRAVRPCPDVPNDPELVLPATGKAKPDFRAIRWLNIYVVLFAVCERP